MFYIILFFAYLISLCFYKDRLEQICAIIFCFLLLFKFAFNNRKCTISYIECKIRKIKKEQGFVYNALDEIYNLNQSRYKYFIISFILFIILLNLKKCIYN